MSEPIRAVYVEDEPTIGKLLPRVLELVNILVTAVYKSAEEFLKEIESLPYQEADVFIFDVRLPGMSGLELAAKMRADGEERPILALSAWPKPPEEELIERQVVFLAKPYEFSDLEQVIHELVGR